VLGARQKTDAGATVSSDSERGVREETRKKNGLMEAAAALAFLVYALCFSSLSISLSLLSVLDC
jgi:hypothetical protein